MRTKIIIVLSAVIILGALGYLALRSRTPQHSVPENIIVGGDRDEHGCIGSAGYSWCEPKNKCLRIWEETCYENLEQEIQHLLAKKYNKPVSEVRISIAKQAGDYASGGIKFSSDNQAPGGVFLAVKINNIWQVVYDGNGSVDCNKMRQEFQFPDEILVPNFCDKPTSADEACVCPSGYIKEGDACNPKCYYSKPQCLMPSVACKQGN